MKKLQSFFRLHFGFSSRQTNGVFFLICFVGASHIFAILYRFEGNDIGYYDISKSDSLAELYQIKLDSLNLAQRDTIFVNSCKQEDWKRVKGIGAIISKRVVEYRNKLGGFYSLDQLNEVYGFPTIDSSKYFLSIDTNKIDRLDVNASSFVELELHPYLNKKQSKMIVNYRNKIGLYRGWDDLIKVYALDSNDYDRLKYYIRF